MLLVIKSREITKDIDAYLGGDPELVREAARRVAVQEGLPSDWLNDGVKGFFYGVPPQIPLADFPGLRVYSVAPEYMVAMKTLAGRAEDVKDLKALIRFLRLSSAEQVLSLVERYVPRRLLTAKVQYIAEALFDEEVFSAPPEPPASSSPQKTSSARARTCSVRCQVSKAPTSSCRCVCGGKNHGSRSNS